MDHDQEAEARRTYEALKQAADADLLALARLLGVVSGDDIGLIKPGRRLDLAAEALYGVEMLRQRPVDGLHDHLPVHGGLPLASEC